MSPRRPADGSAPPRRPPDSHAPRAPITGARLVAHEVLVRILREKAYADRALTARLERTPLDGRDAALATELVYGTLRMSRWLDFQLSALAKQPLQKLPAETLVALRLGAYQLLELRVADHGAVHESVELVRMRNPHQAGFANAVLRELARRRDRGTLASARDSIADPLEALAVETSHPSWLLARLSKELGVAEAEAFARADNQSPPLGLRVNPLRAQPDAVLTTLQAAGIDAQPVPQVPGAIVSRAAGDPARLPSFNAGEITVQDPGAQLVSHFAAPRPGWLVLDACAAPGGKSTHLAELMRDEGRVVSVDVHPGKLRLVTQSAERLGLRCVHTAAADATDTAALRAALASAGAGERAPDLIVLDAPCSGTGTLRRNPEARLREEASLTELTALQDRLIDAVSSLLAPGGTLVYCVCSVTPEEGPERALAALTRHPELRLTRAPAAWLAPWVTPLGDGEALRTWPHRHDVDGFFAARFVRG